MASKTHHTQVAIVGGGAMGGWAAFHLARRGARVTVIERSFPGAQASGVNYGNLRIQGRPMSQLPLSLRAQTIWAESQKLLGNDVEFRLNGHMLLAVTAEQQAKNEAYAKDAAQFGYRPEILDGHEVRKRWPWIAGHARGASWAPTDGAVNPRLVVPAIAAVLREQGVALIEGSPVASAARDGAGFRIHTEAGDEIRADVLLNCAGAWGGAVAGWFGEDVPLFAAGPTEMVTEPLPYFMRPTMQLVDASIVVRQVERGNVIVAGHPRGPVDFAATRSRMAGAKTLTNLQRVADMVPVLAGAAIIRTWSGIEGYLPDMLPVMGASATTPGLWHAFGFSGGGMQLSPAVGAVMSELILDGRSQTPIAPFSIGRFREAADTHESELIGEFDASVLNART